MNEAEWKAFLTHYNRELLSYEEIVDHIARELLQAGWLGYLGASEAEIAAAEGRLSTPLPPSYRAFLKVSNGWCFPSPSIFDLLPASEIVWFREHNQDWIDAFVGPSRDLPPISDEDYFTYGSKQDCGKFRTGYPIVAAQPYPLLFTTIGGAQVVLRR